MTVKTATGIVLALGILGALAVIGKLALSEADANRLRQAGLEGEIETLKRGVSEENLKLFEKLEGSRAEQAELVKRLEAAAAGLFGLEEKTSRLAVERDALLGERDALRAEIAALQKAAAERVAEEERTMAAIGGIRSRQEAAEKLVSDGLAELKALLDRIRDEQRQTRGRLDALAEVVLRGSPAGDGRGSPAKASAKEADGAAEVAVEAVDDKEGLVVIGAGTKHGVVEGALFDLFDGVDRVATVRAQKLYEDFSGCTVESREPAAAIRKGLRAVKR